jgi:hypothetical protein
MDQGRHQGRGEGDQMTLGVKAWLVAKLKANSALTTALGSADKIQFEYPHDFAALPILTYTVIDQGDDPQSYWDDAAHAVESVIQLDVWVNDATSTTIIADLAIAVMDSLLYNTDASIDVPEEDVIVRHKVLRFSRSLTAGDLL